jgi:hypothetical protein
MLEEAHTCRAPGGIDVQLTLVRPTAPEPAEVAVVDLPVAPAARRDRPLSDIVEEWGIQSFPASDPPANW